MPRVNVSAPDLVHDPGRPAGFRRAKARLGPALGARASGATVYEVPPGEAVCPYHYEYGEEEWALVLEGRPTIRTPAGAEQAEPMDLFFFAPGPGGAHQIRNDGDAPARVLMWSTVVLPTVTAYPDSGKVGVWTGDGAEDLVVERSAAVDYFHGEAGG